MADMIQYLTFNSASHNGNIVYANAVAAAQAFGGGTPVTMYTITRNTSNYTISNTAQNVIENARYYAVLAPTSGYQINAVTITMGGVSITSTAWNNATKTIDI
jgi:hypothetical protein